MGADMAPRGGHIDSALPLSGAADNVFSMARSIAIIEQEIRSLSASDQEDLLRVLLEELDGPPDEGAEDAWLDEARRRSEELDSGAVKSVSAREVFETIDSYLKK
jgi:hypothetical protein